MKWNDFLNVLRVRAIEDAGGAGRVWDDAVRRIATLSAQQTAPGDAADFLHLRATQLASAARDPALFERLRVPPVPGWVAAAGGLASFIAGWWFAALGQEREINLLSLPLIAILAWNIAVVLLSLVHGIGRPDSSGPPPWLESALTRFRRESDASSPDPDIRARFRALSWPVASRRLGFRCRAWLHLAAALLALGSAVGIYARGWSTEYRAVWESTLLDDAGARRFFGALFAPASLATGIKIPLDDVASMRRHAGTPAAKPGAALPWIHLYAATLGLFVVIPRLVFALLEQSRAGRIPALHVRTADWRDHVAALRGWAGSDGAALGIIAHGLVVDDAFRERWQKTARARWGDAGPAECRAVLPGDEAEFVSQWEAVTPRVLLVFNLSATPETEVHRALAESLLAKVQTGEKTAPLALTLALDDTELKKRWAGFGDAGAKLATRAASWHEVMRGLGADWI